MGFLDNFFEIEKKDKKQEVTPSVPSISNVTNTSTNYTPSQVPSQDLDKFTQHFEELFDKANLQGPDYYEFAKMLQAMPNLADDVKFTAAFSALKVQGLTKQKLIETAGTYIQVIDEDAKQFSSVLDSKVVGEINKRKQSLEEKKKLIEQKNDLIKKLQEELVNDNADVTTMSIEIANDEKKFTDKTAVYKIACDNKKQIIKTDIEKINTYIK